MNRNTNIWGVLLILVILTTPLVQAAWPMMQNNNQRTGNVSGGTPDTNHVYWKFNVGDRIRSAPVVDNNTVYVTSESGYLYAIDTNGTQKWEKPIASPSNLDFTSSPIIDGNTIYVATNENKIYSLDTSDGSPNWTMPYSAGGSIFSSPLLYNNHLIFGSTDDKVYDLNATTGTLNWTYDTKTAIKSSPAIYNDYIYIGSDTSKIYKLDLTGTLDANYTTGGVIVSTPTIDVNGNVYVGSDDFNFYKFDANLTSATSYTTGNNIRSSAAYDGTDLFVGSDDGYFYSFDSNLSPNWTLNIGSAIHSSPAMTDDYVFFGADNGKFYCTPYDSNTIAWSYTAGASIHSSPAIDNNVIYVGSDDGYLYAFMDNQIPISNVGGPYADNYINETINFDGSSSYDPDPADVLVAYNWDFGDGNVGTGMSPTHSYSTSGDFNVTLTVTDSYGGISATSETTIKISNRPPVLSNGIVTPTGGASTATYNYSVKLTDLDNHNPTLIYVNIDDTNHTMMTSDPTAVSLGRTYTYSTTGLSYGAHSYYFITQDPEGAWDTLDNNGTAYSGPSITYPPVVTIDSGGTTTTVTVNHTATFNGNATDSDGNVVLYEWDFDGDGAYDWNGTSANTTHIYTSVGTYTARLRATDDKGATGTDTITINVVANIAPSANAGPDQTLSSGTNVELPGKGTDSDGTISLYEWDFTGDGTYDWNSTTTGLTFHTYTSGGIYYAKIRVTDNDNASATDTAKIEISNGGGGGGGGGGSSWSSPPPSDDDDNTQTEEQTGTPNEEEVKTEPDDSQELSPNVTDETNTSPLNETEASNSPNTETPGDLPAGQAINPQTPAQPKEEKPADNVNNLAGTAFFALSKNSPLIGAILLTAIAGYYAYKRAKYGKRKDLRWHYKKSLHN